MKHPETACPAGDVLEADWQHGGFGLYIHWPFCEAKCPYCDFNSHVARQIDHDRWECAYISEVRRVALLTRGRTLSTVFFGGGTPSLMRPETVGRILEAVRRSWPVSNSLEVTLEANPSSVEAAKFQAFRDAGVNRVSIGLQSLRDDALRALGRIHTAAEGLKAFETARRIFERTSFDLIYARQGQGLLDWQAELDEALAVAPAHLSLYQLTIEDGTVFAERHRRGRLRGLPDEDLMADLYAVTQERCEAAGLPAYEVSNHATDGESSRHNMIYWRYGDYAGIGPGAHGRLTSGGSRRALAAVRSPNDWLQQIESRGHGVATDTQLSGAEEAIEYLMMSLRLSEGSNLSRYESLCGKPLDPRAIESLVDSGHMMLEGDRIKTTRAGRMVLNAVLGSLI